MTISRDECVLVFIQIAGIVEQTANSRQLKNNIINLPLQTRKTMKQGGRKLDCGKGMTRSSFCEKPNKKIMSWCLEHFPRSFVLVAVVNTRQME